MKKSKRLKSKETFINEMKEIYGDSFNYDDVIYINTHTKVKLTCNICGNIIYKTPCDLLHGYGCNKCSNKKFKKYTKEELITLINNDYEINLTNDEYFLDDLIDVKCKKHGWFKQKVKNRIKGKICKKCSIDNWKKSRVKSVEIFEQELAEKTNKFSFNKEEFVNYQKPITFKCSVCGYKFERKPTAMLLNYTCPNCNMLSNSKTKTTDEYIADAKMIYGDDLYDYSLVNYESSDKKVEIICKKCNKSFLIEANSHLQGHGCPNHFRNKSKQELELVEFIKSIVNCDVLTNVRSLIHKQEIDIYIPDYNIAFEYNGLYWHNELNKPDVNYHLNKTLECEKLGIQLIHIYEDEWIYKQNIVKSMIKHLFNKNKLSIFARKCIVKEVEPKECNKFLEDNHLQGKCPSSIKLGLYYNNELVSLMTFGRSRHFVGSGKCEYELLRFCNRINHSVIGGASKLFKYFINTYNPSEVISYANRRWSVGNLYNKLGFIKYNESKPSYFYVIKNKRVYRFNLRKQVLVEKYGCPKDESERKFCLEQKWYRIYDCGCLCYKWSKK